MFNFRYTNDKTVIDINTYCHKLIQTNFPKDNFLKHNAIAATLVARTVKASRGL